MGAFAKPCLSHECVLTVVLARNTPLRYFLQASMLSTDTETPEDEKSKDVSG